MIEKHRKNRSKEQGFSLIELSIALIIIGTLVGSAVSAYQVYIQNVRASFAAGQFREINNNINYFGTHNARYPMPASLTDAPTDATYGQEFTGTIQPCASGALLTDGICRTAGANPALIGAVPHERLGLHPDYILDYWHNKILYAVTESQTATYTPGNGGITTRNFNSSRVVTDTSSTIDMILISHGQDGAGAFTQQGTLFAPCNDGTGATTLTVDGENCNLDNIFFLEDGSKSDLIDANFYDDQTEEQASIPVDLWLQSVDSTNANSADYVLSPVSRRIGVGTADPLAKLHVKGDIRGDDIHSDMICASGGSGCFRPEIIAGSVAAMSCKNNSTPGDEPVVWIANEQVYCASPVDSGGNPLEDSAFQFPTDFGRTNCFATGQVMSGLDSSGDPICVNP